MVGRIATAFFILFGSISAWASHESRKIATSTTVYGSPGSGALGTAGAGQQYVVASVSGSWVEIWWAGNRVWVAASATVVAPGTGGQVSYSSVPVRSGPASTYASVGTAHAGEIYVVTGTSGSYERIWFGGAERWIYGLYTATHSLGGATTTPPTTTTPPPTTSGELTYPNGHPLRTPTTDATLLANEKEIFTLVNDYRVSIGRNALILHARMSDIGRAHSKHMAGHAFFAHLNPEGDQPWDRLRKGGVTTGFSGENISGGYSSNTAAFNGWLNSPSHKANMERLEWTHTGVGYWYQSGTRWTRYRTQMFARNPSP